MQKDKILIVDDEKDISKLLDYNLKQQGYSTAIVDNGEDSLKLSRELKVDLILLDIMLPGINGIDVCTILKNDSDTENIPIIMLSAKGEENDIIRGLEVGADDYVTKPFSISILSARIKRLLKRNKKQTDNSSISFKELTIEVNSREVYVDNERIELTFTEFEILKLLSSHRKWVYTRDQIIDNVHGEDYAVTDRSIDFQIVGLRKKLGKASRFIKTIRGVGYRFLIDE
jgi:two-component system alkaline phosphatase synthesis response regulator PhoP